MDLIREPRPGETLDWAWGARIVRALKRGRLTAGPGVRVSFGPNGTTVSAKAPDKTAQTATTTPALTLTTTPPDGYTPDPDAVAMPGWVTWGTAGGVVPAAAAFADPVVEPTAAGNLYVWAKIGLSEAVPMLCTSLEFVTSASNTGYATPAFGAGGVTPDFIYVPLGHFAVTGTSPNLVTKPVNNGRGSIAVGLGLTNLTIDANTNVVTGLVRNLSYWRVDAR